MTRVRMPSGLRSARLTMKQWLLHFARTQFLIVLLSVVWLLTTQTTAFTDPPVYTRRLYQLAAAERSTHDRLAVLDEGKGVLISVRSLNQLPQLYNGCEVTSLTMLLRFEGVHANKLTLAQQITRDHTPLVTDGSSGAIVSWGNPNKGFVGSIAGNGPGYGVYHSPLAELLRHYLPTDTLDVSGHPFATILAIVRSGRPVVAWTTIPFSANVPWLSWQSPTGAVQATMLEHVVLIVGYTQGVVFVNNPLGGSRAQRVSLAAFRLSWIAMGRQALTVQRNL